MIADQRPLLCRCRRAERALLLIELKSVRLFFEVPARVSTTADLGAAGCQKIGAVFRNDVDVADEILFLSMTSSPFAMFTTTVGRLVSW